MFCRNKIIFLLILIAVLLTFGFNAICQDTIQMKLGHSSAPVSIRHEYAEKFADLAKEYSDGVIEIEVFPSSQLGQMRDMIDGLKIGTVQCVIDPPSRLSVYTEESKLADIFKMPFVIKSREHGEKVWSSDVGKDLMDKIADESGIIVLAMAWRGARHITSKKEIRSVEDLEGLKIRTPPYDPPLTTWKELGANPVPMEFNELYLGLQQGIVEAQENPVELSYVTGFNEVCDYLVLSGHVREFNGFMFGKKYFEDLPTNIQEALTKAATEAAEFGGDLVEASEEEYIQKFADYGVEVIDVDVSKWEEKLEDWKYEYAPNISPIMREIESMATE